jgi:hypothetical protein
MVECYATAGGRVAGVLGASLGEASLPIFAALVLKLQVLGLLGLIAGSVTDDFYDAVVRSLDLIELLGEVTEEAL